MSDEDRKSFIGGSDVDSVFNLPPYGCKRRLWYEKTGQEPDWPREENYHMKRGKMFEPLAARLYAQATSKKIRRNNTRVVDQEYPFMAGLVDREIVGDPRGVGVLEVKCPTMRTFMKMRKDGSPDAYILQLQHYLRARKASWGAFAFFCAELADLEYFEMERDEDLIKKIIEGEIAFWEMVRRKEKPDKLELGDRRCISCEMQRTCRGEEAWIIDLQAKQPREGVNTILDDELEVLCGDYWRAKEIYDDAEETLTEIRDKIKERMKILNENAVIVGGTKIYRMEQVQKRFDSTRFLKEHPNFKTEYIKPVQIVSMRFYKVNP